MELFVIWADIIVTVALAFIGFILNLPIYEYGSGEDYLIIRVYHFVFLQVGTGAIFILLKSYFKGKAGAE